MKDPGSTMRGNRCLFGNPGLIAARELSGAALRSWVRGWVAVDRFLDHAKDLLKPTMRRDGCLPRGCVSPLLLLWFLLWMLKRRKGRTLASLSC